MCGWGWGLVVARGKGEVNLTGQFARSMTVMNFARCGGEMAVPPRSATCPSWMQSSIQVSREAAPLVLEATRRASWWRRRRGMDGDIMPAGDEGEAREEVRREEVRSDGENMKAKYDSLPNGALRSLNWLCWFFYYLWWNIYIELPNPISKIASRNVLSSEGVRGTQANGEQVGGRRRGGGGPD